MQESFTRARIDSLTLGERLEKLRLSQEISIENLAQNLQIRPSYIKALEKGNYESLPTKVYARGFISAYARYFNVDEKKLVKIFDREYRVYENIHKKGLKKSETINRLPSLPKIVLTSQALIFLSIFLVVSLSIFYLYTSFKNFDSAPWLKISEPLNGVTTSNQEINVIGETKNDARVYINDQLVQVGLDGIFSEKVGLSQGQNEIVVKSVNKFDKESVVNLFVNAKFEEVSPLLIETEKKPISLKIKVTEDILLKVTADDIIFNDILKKDSEKVFSAKEKIIVSTDSGKNTLVSFNNADLERMSDKDTPIKDIVFEEKEAEDKSEFGNNQTSTSENKEKNL